ncbi:hypothetical protein E2C01_084633 [Portunus trituberculatus]|uniref:Uncharacterized protein n=1 Tax=Portunus trituberculatus TaxID=210409 RepID=A0A5B7J4Q8_PORTR|nr:hypothetical protein [Portunus trituberculatus]
MGGGGGSSARIWRMRARREREHWRATLPTTPPAPPGASRPSAARSVPVDPAPPGDEGEGSVWWAGAGAER